MNKFKLAFLSLAVLAILSLSLSAPLRSAHAQRNGDGGGGSPIIYPPTKKVEVVDDYFGTKVLDPYRWTEEKDSTEVAAWVEAENRITYAYLDKISLQADIKDSVMMVYTYQMFSW